MSRASEREAARKAAGILLRAAGRGEVNADYGAGKLTKHQEESQKKHIAMTERDNSRGAKVRRALWG